MRVVVTGGAGYIGSVVTDQLIADGHDVLVIDNLVKGHRDAVNDSAQFAEIDLIERDAVTTALGEFGADAVVHMAAASLVGESVTDPAKYYRENMVAGLSLLDAMRDAAVSRLVFSSTAAVYGDPEKQPIEETDATAPTNPYGATKLAFEQALPWYGAAYGLSSISLRYFNAAGATRLRAERHDPETHLIPLVLDVAAGRRPEILVFGDDYDTHDGTCIRDYIHVADLARAHALALHALDDSGQARAYNLGCGGGGYSVREVLDAARRITGAAIQARVVARRPGDPPVLVASSARIARDLGWQPAQPSLDEIIETAWRGNGSAKTMAASGELLSDDCLQHGCTSRSALADFHALRASVLGLYDSSGGSDLTDVRRFNDAIDVALAEAMDRFAAQADLFRDQLIGALGDDLRTPLGVATKGAALLAAEEENPQPRAWVVARSMHIIQRMERMIGDLLDLTQARLGGAMPIKRRPSDLRQISEVAMLEIRAGHPEAVLRFQACGDLRGEWDADRLARVVSNLVGNAIQHGGGTLVTLTGQEQGDWVKLAVHNGGPPIPAEVLPFVFEPLARSRAEGASGSIGLGLVIARALVSAHGGDIQVSSSADAGTTFTVRLPKTS